MGVEYVKDAPPSDSAATRLGGFPADRVLEVASVIDPTTAEAHQFAA